MSGIEVIGVVLGVLPLVISGLEHYAEGAETIKRIWSAPRDFRALSTRIEAEGWIFRHTVELLLQNCVELELQQGLLKDDNGDLWRDAEVQAVLRSKLGSCMSVYIEHVQNIAKALQEFRARLHLGECGKGPFGDGNITFREAYQRFRFALKKSAYEDLLEEIHKDNLILDKLTQQREALQVTNSDSKKRRKQMPDFHTIRDTAIDIFVSLQQSVRATCSIPHRLSLRVTPKTGRKTQQSLNALSTESVRVALDHMTTSTESSPLRWSLVETEIRSIVRVQVNEPAPKICGVRFLDHDPDHSVTPPLTGVDKLTVADEIHDMCASLAGFSNTQTGICLGHLARAKSPYLHAIYQSQQSVAHDSPLSILSLAEVFRSDRGPYKRLSNRDIHKMAISLTTAVLSLYDTPWCGPTLTRDNVTLFIKNEKIDSQHPFLSARVSVAGAEIQPQTTRKITSPVIRNTTLFALGLILIQLYSRKSMDELYRPEDLNSDGTTNDLSDYSAAVRLIESEEMSEELGEGWNQVVRRCVYCDLNQRKADFSDPKFRQAIYEDILLEPEDSLAKFEGIGIERTL